ncbi:hypothetical protein HO173_007524 [Letharia columbiana]|uniref:Uncharacterized protein n=1 Tax=Letharia columbiana TaxID=112416 RepID=A0A8H6L3H6_9LECA|nr:uncharacterized protein HO173_007524 [Letharia columbiana]KAF6234105.1 hypothetical protein HO173_007524 [Letharia columbiana]
MIDPIDLSKAIGIVVPQHEIEEARQDNAPTNGENGRGSVSADFISHWSSSPSLGYCRAKSETVFIITEPVFRGRGPDTLVQKLHGFTLVLYGRWADEEMRRSKRGRNIASFKACSALLFRFNSRIPSIRLVYPGLASATGIRASLSSEILHLLAVLQHTPFP